MGSILSVCFTNKKQPAVVVHRWDPKRGLWVPDRPPPRRRRVSIHPSVGTVDEDMEAMVEAVGSSGSGGRTRPRTRQRRLSEGSERIAYQITALPVLDLEQEVELDSAEYMTPTDYYSYNQKRRESIKSYGLPCTSDFCTCAPGRVVSCQWSGHRLVPSPSPAPSTASSTGPSTHAAGPSQLSQMVIDEADGEESSKDGTEEPVDTESEEGTEEPGDTDSREAVYM